MKRLLFPGLPAGLALAQGVVPPPDFPREVADLEALHDAGQYVQVHEEGVKRGTLFLGAKGGEFSLAGRFAF